MWLSSDCGLSPASGKPSGSSSSLQQSEAKQPTNQVTKPSPRVGQGSLLGTAMLPLTLYRKGSKVHLYHSPLDSCGREGWAVSETSVCPCRSRDFYHTCYCLSGLSIAQHFGSGAMLHDVVMGVPENVLVRQIEAQCPLSTRFPRSGDLVSEWPLAPCRAGSVSCVGQVGKLTGSTLLAFQGLSEGVSRGNTGPGRGRTSVVGPGGAIMLGPYSSPLLTAAPSLRQAQLLLRA